MNCKPGALLFVRKLNRDVNSPDFISFLTISTKQSCCVPYGSIVMVLKYEDVSNDSPYWKNHKYLEVLWKEKVLYNYFKKRHVKFLFATESDWNLYQHNKKLEEFKNSGALHRLTSYCDLLNKL